MQTVPQIIEALGGSAEIARDTSFPLTTIESWKSAGFIPPWRRDALLSMAARREIALSTADFPPKRARAAPVQAEAA